MDKGENAAGRHHALTPENMLLLCLVRMRQSLKCDDVAYRMGIAVSVVSRTFTAVINFLHAKLYEIDIWPPRWQIDLHMPTVFKEMYPDTRVIIDATEIFCARPVMPSTQQALYSNYKSRHTLKGLIGISPGGAVTFVSSLYAGSISDKQLVIECGLLEKLERQDEIMADRGFINLQNETDILGIKLNVPPTKRGKTSLSPEEKVKTRRIANKRIFVEHRIRRIKEWECMRYMPASMSKVASQIFRVIAFLTNFEKPSAPTSELNSDDSDNNEEDSSYDFDSDASDEL